MKFHRIYIEITNRCNLSCSFCGNNQRRKEEMSLEAFEHILKEITGKTDIILLHVTGEPLLHSQFDEILNLCDYYGFRVHLTTNGTLLKDKIHTLHLHHCLEKLSISLHCEQHMINYFEQVFASVDRLSPDLVVIYRLWALPNGKLDEKSTAIVEKIRRHYSLSTEVVEKLYIDNNIKIGENRYVDKAGLFKWPKISSYKSHGFCQGLKSQLAILSDGSVVPCCLDSEGIVNLGNIFEQDLDIILKSDRVTRIRKGFQDNKAVASLCQSCYYKNRF